MLLFFLETAVFFILFSFPVKQGRSGPCFEKLNWSGLTELNKLQRVQNAAARLISRTPKSHHITPILQQLHWLPVKDRISFKLLLLTFKALHGLAPVYISELIKPYNPSRSLRSSTLNYLSVPKSNTATYGDRCFSVAAPKLWNSLPGDFRYIENLCTFKLVLRNGFLNPHLI